MKHLLNLLVYFCRHFTIKHRKFYHIYGFVTSLLFCQIIGAAHPVKKYLLRSDCSAQVHHSRKMS